MVSARSGDDRTAKKSPKDEILALREDVGDLEHVLARLQRKRRDALDHHYTPWKKLAFDQSAERLEALQENEKLRKSVVECRTLANSLLQFMQRAVPSTRELGTVEESEWKLNILGAHPHRRHWNADRIMERMYRKLPSWAINNGLVDARQDTYFSRCDHRDNASQSAHLEVVMCRRFNGHYLDVADAVWRYFARDDIDASGAVSLLLEPSEILGDRIRHNKTGLRMVVDRHVVTHTMHQLCQRIEEDTRIVLMWKGVSDGRTTSPIQFTENVDGWISFEKSFDDDYDVESCIMKFSSITDILPIDRESHRPGEYLVKLLRMMNLAADLEDPAAEDGQLSIGTIERARRVFVDFLCDALWRHSDHLARLAARDINVVEARV